MQYVEIATTSQKNDKKKNNKNKGKLKKKTNKPATRQTSKYREFSGEKRERTSSLSWVFVQIVCTPILRLYLKKVRVQFQKEFKRF